MEQDILIGIASGAFGSMLYMWGFPRLKRLIWRKENKSGLVRYQEYKDRKNR